jgi:hypothetical protein
MQMGGQLRRPLGVFAVALGHGLGLGGVAAFLGRAQMAGHALVGVEALDRLRGQAYFELVLHQLVRHRVVMAVDFDVVVDVYAYFFPLGVDVRLFGQRLQRGLVDVSQQYKISGVLRLGVLRFDPSTIRLPRFVKILTESYPEIELQLVAAGNMTFKSMILEEKLDAAISLLHGPVYGVDKTFLAHLDFCLEAPNQWYEYSEGKVKNLLASQTWLRQFENSVHHSLFDDLASQVGVNPKLGVLANNESIMYSLIAGGVGIGLLRTEQAIKGEKAGDFKAITQINSRARLSFLTDPSNSKSKV